MKKILAGFLCTTAMLSAVAPTFAIDAHNLTISPNPTKVVSQKADSAQYTIEIDGKHLELGTLKVVKINNIIMVPLRVTSKAMGFTVAWDGKKRAIHMDNGTMQTDLTIGENSYCAYSSKAIGMTAPESLGLAPTIIGGSTYVPVEIYNILFTCPNCVSVKGNAISISTDSSKQNKASGSAQIPCPLISYSTLDEARKAVGFQFQVPSTIPDGYQMKDIIVISNDLAEVFYTKGDSTILYRTSKGDADISGDYNVYDKVKTITAENAKVTVKGSNDSISLATWTKDGCSYSLSFSAGAEKKAVQSIIESMGKA